MPFFSVIVPTYNRLTLLREALASIEQQTFTDYEVIVVDDGSTDGTNEYLKLFEKKLLVVRQENRGAGAARNAGAAIAKGLYLAFLDSDDLWFPWTLDVYHQIVLTYSSPNFITGSPLIMNTVEDLSKAIFSGLSVEVFDDYYASCDEWRWFSASSFVIRKDAFEVVKGFHELWGAEDAHLAMKLGCSPGFVHVKQPFTFCYRKQASSLMSEPTYSSSGAKLLIASEKNGEFPGGVERRHQRWKILTRHIRPTTLSSLRDGLHSEAWSLYRATFAWNLALLRSKYLIGFPLVASLSRRRHLKILAM